MSAATTGRNEYSGGDGMIAKLTQEYNNNSIRNNSEDDDDGMGGIQEAEDFLQRLFAELACFPDPPLLADDDDDEKQVEAFLVQSSKILMWSSIPDDDVLPIIVETDTTMNSVLQRQGHDSWGQGLHLAARLADNLSGTELHAAVASFLLQQSPFGHTATGGGPAFATSCLLLCCRALRQCPAPRIERRWKRWQSVLLETIRLYQQFGLKHREQHHPELSIRLWCQYVSPALAHLQRSLLAGSIPADPMPRWMAYEAGSIWCYTRLAVICIHATTSNSQQLLLSLLLESLDRDVLRGRYELLYEHPWWRHQVEAASIPKTPDGSLLALALYTTTSQNWSDEEEHREQVLGMDTVWCSLGVGILVATAGWDNRPNVWTAQNTWRTFFPHVDALLMGLRQEDEELEDDNGLEENVESPSGSNAPFVRLGFDLLQKLLQNTPDASLSVLQLSSKNAPDSPIGTCQLIANHMVLSISQETPSNHGEAPPTTAITVLRSAAGSFQILKQLVAKYSFTYQVHVVRQLFEECPHVGLRPKLIDLLRSFVSWNEPDAESRVWHFLETEFLTKLECQMENIDNSSLLHDLMDHAEVYCAALGLLQLWLLCKKVDAIDGIDNLPKRLASIHNSALERFSAKRSENSIDNLPTQYFRLHLLESSLVQTLELLSVKT